MYAEWFACLGDTARILLLNRLALAERAMSVGQIVAFADAGQSTVSHHLRVVANTNFVVSERRGTSTVYKVNAECLGLFPAGAEVVMAQRSEHSEADEPPCNHANSFVENVNVVPNVHTQHQSRRAVG